MAALELVAFDIETTGFAVTDTVTVAGFALPVGVRVFCQTGGRAQSSEAVESAVQDRIDDSQAAVTAFEAGDFGDLVVHNVADVQRTRELGLVAERYCSKSDFQLKSLTPTVDSTD